jgi:hypothetical protein
MAATRALRDLGGPLRRMASRARRPNEAKTTANVSASVLTEPQGLV